MTAGTKGDTGFLALAGAILVSLGYLNASFATYFWFLLSVVAVRTVRQALRRAQTAAAALAEELQRERGERVDAVARLTTTVEELAAALRRATPAPVVTQVERPARLTPVEPPAPRTEPAIPRPAPEIDVQAV